MKDITYTKRFMRLGRLLRYDGTSPTLILAFIAVF